ncbi:MAG TPA: DUF4173 domain-containing protein [Candidatus Limnocylindria bacterium]|nr:DUF4173 domain-containing protein [Candidatus Limnocylindria bacterium]
MQLSPKQISLVALASLLLGCLWDYLFNAKIPGISFVIYVSLLVGVFFWFSNYLKLSFSKPVSSSLKWLAVPIIFFSAMLAVRDSYFLAFWNIVATFGLLLIFVSQATGRNLRDYRLFDFFITAIALPLKLLASSFRALGQLLTVNKHLKDNQTASQIIKGVLITLPVLLFFLVLLSSADLVFGHLISNLFKWHLDFQSLSRLWWILAVAFIWFGTYVYMFTKSSPVSIPPSLKEASYRFGKIESSILLATLNALFLIFVIIQIKYLFAGQTAITSLGYTYAEYAHKGFAELVVVAILSFGLIFGTEKYIEKKASSHYAIFKVLSGTLIVLLVIIMASAFTRLSLYEQAYGFTLLRLLVQSFIVWLSLIFLVLYYKVLKFLPEKFLAFWGFVLIIGFFVFWNILNPDAFIARKNIQQFAANNQLDTVYLSSLSTDAVPEIVKLLDMQGNTNKLGEDLAVTAVNILKSNVKYSPPWQSWNWSRSNATKIISQKLK